ncbi:hypothetical protein I315_03651 [Cryptococcus gattii Ru294]|uniref:Uncharacterized protein n=2 Tax=Cryptococcus gattii TaxID=37769 RepID=E6R5T7_CRYGW|nr:Hypothetical Protein CGB_D2480W [Cryptococcus gattii WM276]KIR54027.1 hypothetical protein I315_03651 [Cryptococcus gattii Ru294]KIR80959.1 hypothetical protein I306_01999 [Cryptococcus gattii EJB2]KIY33975.1 hypothetical protein I305_03320 [Cryptococcus gattii E566]KJE03024.1 hypothetical protein I311_03303 [Cryptococcus gattii NT-10]ADV21636.1 Hypothetical Protein CGB_D2480W [Cryptococcus gattii WM276]
MSGTQSPSSNKPDPMLPKDAPQMTQADQRPAASGNKPGAAPGENSKGSVSAAALKTAQQSADSLSGEGGKSRKEVETGPGPT